MSVHQTLILPLDPVIRIGLAYSCTVKLFVSTERTTFSPALLVRPTEDKLETLDDGRFLSCCKLALRTYRYVPSTPNGYAVYRRRRRGQGKEAAASCWFVFFLRPKLLNVWSRMCRTSSVSNLNLNLQVILEFFFFRFSGLLHS